MDGEGGEEQWVVRGDGDSQYDGLVTHALMLPRGSTIHNGPDPSLTYFVPRHSGTLQNAQFRTI
jgi:hypothetical protein